MPFENGSETLKNRSESPPGSAISPAVQDCIKTLLSDPSVKQGFEFLKSDHQKRVEETLEMVKIPSSPFGEAERARDFMRRFKDLGLEDVHIDSEGNVIGLMRGERAIPKMVISAHLDTVFPKGYDTNVTIDDNGVIHCPGIADDTAGLSALLSLVRTFKETGIRTAGDILFVGTVGEEGRGDLRGVKNLFSTIQDIDAFISIDGKGADRIAYQALGSKRFEFIFKGAGGHSSGAFGKVASPLHAMGRAVSKIADIQVPEKPRTTFAVSIVSGGTSINAIPTRVAIQTDTRSECPQELEKIVSKIVNYVKMGAVEENAFWKIPWDSTGNVDVEIHKVGDRPSFRCPADTLHVQIAYAATLAIGKKPILRGPASTDSSIAIGLGVPAVSLGRGGTEYRTHSLQEAWDPTDAFLAPQRVFLTALAFGGVSGRLNPLLGKGPAYRYEFAGVVPP